MGGQHPRFIPEPTGALVPAGPRAQSAGSSARLPSASSVGALQVNTASSPMIKATSAFKNHGKKLQIGCSRRAPLTCPSGRRTCSLSPLRHPRSLRPAPVLADDYPLFPGLPPLRSNGSGGGRGRGPGHWRGAPGPERGGRCWAEAGSPAATHRRPSPGMLLPDVSCLLSLLFS